MTKPPIALKPVEHVKWGTFARRFLKGNGIELASGGHPIMPNSIQFELTEETYARYNSNLPLRGPVHWRSDDAIFDLPFRDEVLDYVVSSHLLEDFLDWTPLLLEWVRVLKRGGCLLVAIPDKTRWNAAVAAGQTPNCAHRHEGRVGELTEATTPLGMRSICDMLTEMPKGDYNILYVGVKL